VKDFPFWKSAIYNAKNLINLKSVGEELAQFQNQTGLFGDGEKKLTDGQVESLRKQYAEKMKKLKAEAV
jgi:hypothetical protein